jgi:MoxR-like ATPase
MWKIWLERRLSRDMERPDGDTDAILNPGPVSMDDLRSRFAEFRASRPELIRLAIRRRRVRELQGLLVSGDVPLDAFNREVWPLETTTRLDGEQISGRGLFEDPIPEELLARLERAIDDGGLDLHGNYLWGSGSRVFGSGLTRLDDSDKDRLVARALAVLRDDELSSLEKAEAIDAIPGFGPNISTGLVMVMDPAGFEIWNKASMEALERLGYPVRDLKPFEEAAAALRLELRADDFLELDWFLYQLRKGEYGGLPSVQAEPARAAVGSVSREAGESPRVWIVRAGRQGRDEHLALEQGVAVIGWSEIGELSPLVSRDEIKRLLRESTGEEREPSLASQAGEIYRFIHEVEDGDLVVLPLLSNPSHVAVGRTAGSYQYRSDGPFEDRDAKHTRPVNWLAKSLPYEAFGEDLQSSFGQQGTLSEISKPDAAQRILAAVTPPQDSALHVLLRWSTTQEPRTVDLHREVADQHGAVWWAKIGDPAGRAAIAAKRLSRLRQQLAEDVPTFVYLHRTGEVWRTRLLEITVERPAGEAELIPEYYRKAIGEHNLWVKLADFERLPADFAERELVLDGSADPESMAKAFKGQASMLYVRSQSAVLPHAAAGRSTGKQVWWVNQGTSFERARAGGYLWAPKLTKDGLQRADWDALSMAEEGDVVLNYANGSIRAVSSVTAEAVEATRPDPAQDKAWSDEGRRLEVGYRELKEPIPLSAIPIEWRLEGVGPFDKNGSVKQGYFYRLSDAFVSRLARRFPQLGLERSPQVVERLSAAAVKETAEGTPYHLRLEGEVYATLVAALESEKHVILTGPPGTAKTTLAQAVADTAQRLGLCDGYLLTTATADWTTYETIGGLKPKASGRLEFEPGHFLKAIEERQWLVIDELNRSQFDRAFGQLFTVLSGQPVTLPYSRSGDDAPLSLVPEGVTPPINAGDIIRIPREWRIVATMNVFDKSLLFEMSYALMRRFAFIEVPSPSDPVFEELIELWAEESEQALDVAKDLLAVRQIKDIGPAVYRDIAHFAAQRLRLGEADESQLRFQSFYSYLLPQV